MKLSLGALLIFSSLFCLPPLSLWGQDAGDDKGFYYVQKIVPVFQGGTPYDPATCPPDKIPVFTPRPDLDNYTNKVFDALIGHKGLCEIGDCEGEDEIDILDANSHLVWGTDSPAATEEIIALSACQGGPNFKTISAKGLGDTREYPYYSKPYMSTAYFTCGSVKAKVIVSSATLIVLEDADSKGTFLSFKSGNSVECMVADDGDVWMIFSRFTRPSRLDEEPNPRWTENDIFRGTEYLGTVEIFGGTGEIGSRGPTRTSVDYLDAWLPQFYGQKKLGWIIDEKGNKHSCPDSREMCLFNRESDIMAYPTPSIVF